MSACPTLVVDGVKAMWVDDACALTISEKNASLPFKTRTVYAVPEPLLPRTHIVTNIKARMVFATGKIYETPVQSKPIQSKPSKPAYRKDPVVWRNYAVC